MANLLNLTTIPQIFVNVVTIVSVVFLLFIIIWIASLNDIKRRRLFPNPVGVNPKFKAALVIGVAGTGLLLMGLTTFLK